MAKTLRVFFTGLLISALGTLPLGTLNIISMQLSVAEGYRQAISFALGAALVEMVYVRISLVGMDWVRRRKILFKWLDWVAFIIVLALAVANFIAAASAHTPGDRNVVLSNQMPRFLLGLLMSAINPAQIPFWFGWSTILFSKKILEPTSQQYNFYIIGIGLGTLTGFSVFVFGGQLFGSTLEQNASLVSFIIGSVFTIAAIIQLVKILQGKGIAGRLKEKVD